jgi:diguanylate cyclase
VSTLSREQGLRFCSRIRLLRTVGLAAGIIMIGGVFREQGAHPLAWALLAFDALVWPQLAWLLALRSADPYAVERRSLMIDSASGGIWVVLMHFNLLPSVLLFVMLTMDKIGIGGPRFLAQCVAAQAGALALTGLVFGFQLDPVTTMPMIVACLPLLVVYPLMVGISSQRLSQRVREQNRMLAEMSRVDGLTGIYNRVYWEQLVSSEFERQKRSGSPATLMMIDVDEFKRFNDRYGHLVGDEVIRGVAARLRGRMRRNDLAGRYGGDEFGVILPDTGTNGAMRIADRIRVEIGEAVLAPAAGVRATVSIGVAAAKGAADYRDWIERADRALYAAKQDGRNRVESFDVPDMLAREPVGEER